MTRVKISAAILGLLLLASIVSGVWVNVRCGRLISAADRVAELYEGGASGEAVAEAKALAGAYRRSSAEARANVTVMSDFWIS